MTDYNNNNPDTFDLEDILEDNQFVLLPPDIYTFQVVQLDLNERFNGSAKMPPCRKVCVHLDVYTNDTKQKVSMKEDFIFYKPLAWKVFAFFRALGLFQNNDNKVKIPWLLAQGCWGRAKIGQRSWFTQNGDERKTNQVEQWIEPDENVLKANAKAVETYRRTMTANEPAGTMATPF